MALAALGVGLAGCRRPVGVQAETTWKPDPSRVGGLAPETSLPDFRLRPPEGYHLIRRQERFGEGFAFVGPARADGTHPMVMGVVMKRPSPQAPMPTPEKALADSLAIVARRRRQFSPSSPEHGTINGVPFVRARWDGADLQTGKMMHGVYYVAVDDRRIFQLSTQDLDPYSQQSLPLGEASLQTFQKQ
jgi:hypothetical protein